MVEVKENPTASVTITPRAAQEIVKIKNDNNIPETHALRLGVKGGGCSGLTYVLAFDEKPRVGDNEFEMEGIKIYVDPKSLAYLAGTTLDFSDGLNGKGFVFNNPNATKTCGCGSSFCA
ncbi:MAG: iron-sulfur cluster assembly accessory protein [Ignavibacteriales bacterium]|nr:iron-sulfur cluster assembly accessory protein [Ignavibacteriales bacterium]MBI3788958.1 iron-sulfur cluster assembly accessory protein [Ignavibacteriales bacterium]